MSFDPDRFLASPPPPDPRDYVFGFGRRVCPGKLLADSSIWLTIANSLAAFDIRKAVDESGEVVEPSVLFTPGIISHPYPFRAEIGPRSQKYEDLIRAVEREHPWEESSAEVLERMEVG